MKKKNNITNCNESTDKSLSIEELNIPNIIENEINEEPKKTISDLITYAKYKVIRDKHKKIIDMKFVYANNRMKDILDADPTGLYRSQVLPINDKICHYALNVLDLTIPKHFSYQSNIKGFEYIEAIIEPDIVLLDIVHIYTVDIDIMQKYNVELILRNNVSTVLSMFNITILHWNAKEHYIYNDSILTTDFSSTNPVLYTGNNIRDSYTLYKITNLKQKEEIDAMVKDMLNNNKSFLSFSVFVKNSINEDILVKVNVIKEQLPNMYMIGIQY